MNRSVIKNILLITMDYNNKVNKNFEKFCKYCKKIYDNDFVFKSHIEFVFNDYNFVVNGFKDKYVNHQDINLMKRIIDFDSKYGDCNYNFNTLFQKYKYGADMINNYLIQENIESSVADKVMEDYFKCLVFPMRYLR